MFLFLTVADCLHFNAIRLSDAGAYFSNFVKFVMRAAIKVKLKMHERIIAKRIDPFIIYII